MNKSRVNRADCRAGNVRKQVQTVAPWRLAPVRYESEPSLHLPDFIFDCPVERCLRVARSGRGEPFEIVVAKRALFRARPPPNRSRYQRIAAGQIVINSGLRGSSRDNRLSLSD